MAISEKQLEYFLVAYQEKNLLNASKKCFISQQAMSQAIKNMELDFGLELFYRHSKGIQSTEFADFLYQKTLAFQKEKTKFFCEIDLYLREQKQELSVALSGGVLEAVGAKSIFDYIELHPECTAEKLELPDMDCVNLLEKEEVDLVFVVKPPDVTAFEYVPYGREQIYFLCHKNHTLAKEKVISFKKLKQLKLATFYERFYFYQLILDAGKSHGFLPNIIFQSSEKATISQLVSTGECCSFAVDHVISDLPTDLVHIPFSDLETPWEIGFLYPKNSKKKKEIRDFIQYYEKLRDGT